MCVRLQQQQIRINFEPKIRNSRLGFLGYLSFALYCSSSELSPPLKQLLRQKELDMLMKVKEVKGCVGKGSDNDDDGVDGSIDSSKIDDFCRFFKVNRIDLGAQELILMEAANGLMSKLRFLLEPLKFVTDDGTPWEEKSAVVRLSDKINKSKRNKLWRKRKRRRVAESLAKEEEQFKKLDREANEWKAKEIAKDMAEQKIKRLNPSNKRVTPLAGTGKAGFKDGKSLEAQLSEPSGLVEVSNGTLSMS